MNKFDVIIIGGGPAGTSAANYLANYDFNVCLVEKKVFPRDVICGEFLSFRVLDHLKNFGLFDDFINQFPTKIDSLRYSTENKEFVSELGFTAYSMKRSKFDDMLLCSAKDKGINIYQPYEALTIKKKLDNFIVEIANDGEHLELTANNVFSAYGKQNVLDKYLNRHFFGKKSSLTGIKFYAEKNNIQNFLSNEIRIYTSSNVYCGVDQVNDKEINFCLLTNGNNSIAFDNLYSQNKFFASLFKDGIKDLFMQAKKYGTGNVYFGKKNVIENGIYMMGDSARMIAPLTGDGIDMAMEAGYIAANVLKEKREHNLSNEQAQGLYEGRWERTFSSRIRNAKMVQNILLSNRLYPLTSIIPTLYPGIIKKIIKYTRK